MFYRMMADAVVVTHLAYVLFVVLALMAILVGWLRGWHWTRNFWFRLVHLLMIAVVVAESLLGITCPLTTLEQNLRRSAGEAPHAGSFVGRWAHELLFIEAEPWQFTVAYCVFGGAVVLALVLAPPRLPGRKKNPTDNTAEGHLLETPDRSSG
ncbi:MAG: DUF2784 domain-containing protein [Pirellulales bacterium]